MRLSRLQLRLLAALFLAVAAGCLPTLGIVVWTTQAKQAEDVAADGAALASATAQTLDTVSSQLDFTLRALRSAPALRQAVADRDRGALVERMQRAHAELAPLGVTAFAITTPDMRVLYRTNAPEVFGDGVGSRRPDLVAVQQGGEPQTSFAQVRDNLALARAVPLEQDGRRVGVLSAQVNFLESFYARLRSTTGASIVMHMLVDGAPRRAGGTTSEPTGLDAARFKSAFDGAPEPYVTRLGEREANAVLVPVRDFSGKPLAVIELLRDRSEQAAAGRATIQMLVGIGGAVLVVAMGLGWMLTQTIARPLRQTIAAAGGLARGETETPVPGATRRDELGELARALDVLRENTRRMALLQEERDAARLADTASRRELLRRLAGEAEGQVGAVAEAVAGAAAKLTGAAEHMSATVQAACVESSQAGEAGSAASANVQAVAAAADELNASIAEIARQVDEQAGLTRQAQDQAGRSVDACGSMNEAARHVESIVSLISNIAARTNLLALNATIEAARAGDAGRGFAVVAAEVKSLASQTEAATGEIGAKIALMQSAASSNARELEEIGRTVGALDTIAGSIAAAVQQQSAATAEIARAVEFAARDTDTAKAAIERTAERAASAGTTCDSVTSATGDLSAQAGRLRAAMDRFVMGLSTEPEAATAG